jgi:hypothetical protein
LVLVARAFRREGELRAVRFDTPPNLLVEIDQYVGQVVDYLDQNFDRINAN